MNPKHNLPQIVSLVVIVIWLSGCASEPSRFYTLTPLAPPEAQLSPRDRSNPLSVRVAPVEIPDYLDRPQIVTRNGRNEVRLAELDRWAGSLSDNISTVLADNLSMLLRSDRVFVDAETTPGKADCLVAMRVLRLDCVPGSYVLLKAQWSVVAGQERADSATHVSTFTEKLNDSRYDTLTAGVSRTIEQVSREVARKIMERPKEETGNPPVQTSP